jgi:hypothetical protein
MHTEFWYVNLKETDHMEDLSVDKRITLKWILGKLSVKMNAGLKWLRIGSSGVLL